MKKFRNRKSVDSINNVLDAFLALKDIDDEEVIGMVRNVKKIDEGVDISLVTSTNAELDDAREFIKNDKKKDEDVEIEVIDANADAKTIKGQEYKIKVNVDSKVNAIG